MDEQKIDVLFLGGLIPKEFEDEIIKDSIKFVQNAANVLQWGLVNGLEKQPNCDVKIINSIYIGHYPKYYKKLFIKTREFSHNGVTKDIDVGFINIKILKHFNKYSRLKKYLKKWACEPNQYKVVIAYAMTYPFVKSLSYIKKINNNIVTSIIVPDLPEYMNLSAQKGIYEFLKNKEISMMRKLQQNIDFYVLLTKQMSNKLDTDKFVVVEGISTDLFDGITPVNFDMQTILYAGTYTEKYGVLNIVEAFKMLKHKDAQLLLCGSGECNNKLSKEAEKNNRIINLGLVEREKVLALIKGSSIVINPRQNKEEYTKYSFPSKNLEYLSSGVPFIAYKLDGIPDEYDKYINYVEDNDIASLAEKIDHILDNREEYLEKANLAKEFVLNEKNNKKQTKKIIDYYKYFIKL